MVPYSCEYFSLLLSSKGEGVPGHTIKACGGCEGLAPLILKLGTGCQWLVSVMAHLLCAPLLPIRYEAGWSPEPVWMLGEAKYFLHIPGIDHNSVDMQPIVQSLYLQCCYCLYLLRLCHLVTAIISVMSAACCIEVSVITSTPKFKVKPFLALYCEGYCLLGCDTM